MYLCIYLSIHLIIYKIYLFIYILFSLPTVGLSIYSISIYQWIYSYPLFIYEPMLLSRVQIVQVKHMPFKHLETLQDGPRH